MKNKRDPVHYGNTVNVNQEKNEKKMRKIMFYFPNTVYIKKSFCFIKRHSAAGTTLPSKGTQQNFGYSLIVPIVAIIITHF